MKTFKELNKELNESFDLKTSAAAKFVTDNADKLKEKVKFFNIILPQGKGEMYQIGWDLDDKGNKVKAAGRSKNQVVLQSMKNGWKSVKPGKKPGTIGGGEDVFAPGKTFKDEQVLAFLKSLV